jgi:DNA-binding transcriptional ArsR family regulator
MRYRRRWWLRQAWRVVRWWLRFCWTRRRPLAPLYLALVLQVLGLVLASAAGGVRTTVVLAALCAAWLGWRLHGRVPVRGARPLMWTRRATPDRNRLLYAWGVYAAATAWLVTAAAIGGGPPMPGFLVLAVLAGGVPWWWHHRIRQAPALGDWAAIWRERVAADSAALPGSQLTEYAPMKAGWSATIELPPGKSTTSTAVAATERIASAYGKPVTSVVIEPTASGDASRARLMVLTTNPLQGVHPWPGPQLLDATTGTAPVGVYPDAEQAAYRFWQPGSGAVHGLVAGTTGAGKSQFVGMLLAYERHSGRLIVSWVCDPQHGQSLPDWMDHVDFAARSAEEGVQMLHMARAVMYARNRYLADVEWTDEQGRRRKGRASFEPTPEMPLLSVTVEEAHAVFVYDEAVKLAEEIGKMGRKCGVSLRLITQVPLLSQLGNSMTLRDAVAGGNVIVLRTANRLSGQVAFNGTLPVDPAQLPRRFPDGSSTSGLGFMIGATDRQAPMRGFFDVDPFGWATAGETNTLDPYSSRAAELAARKAGTGYRNRPEPVSCPAGTEEAAEVASTADAPWRDAYPTAREAILGYLQGRRRATTGVIARDLDVPLPTVSKTLGRLAAAGLVSPVRRGVWAVAGDDRDVEASA